MKKKSKEKRAGRHGASGAGKADPRKQPGKPLPEGWRFDLREAMRGWPRVGGSILVTCAFVLPFWYAPPFRNAVAVPLACWTARIVSGLLNLFSADTVAAGERIISKTFPMTVVPECLALEPTALFLGCVLCFPARAVKKAMGIACGLIVLHVSNILRMAGLYFIGSRFPSYWDAAHIHVSQAFLVLLVVVMWWVWLRWATDPAGGARC